MQTAEPLCSAELWLCSSVQNRLVSSGPNTDFCPRLLFLCIKPSCFQGSARRLNVKVALLTLRHDPAAAADRMMNSGLCRPILEQSRGKRLAGEERPGNEL